MLPGQYIKALLNGIRSRPAFPERIRVRVGCGLRDWVEAEQIKRLHGPVLHHGNPKRAQLPVGFGNIRSPKRKRLITSLLQLAYGCFFLRRSVPQNPVHSWSSFTGVFSHLFAGESLAAKRVGKKMLQGANLAPSLFLCGLHDTRLEPPHAAPSSRPLDGLPVRDRAGE